MLTRNREKRKISDEHGGRAINSVLEYSTVSRNDAMEFEEVLTMDHEGIRAAVDDDVERPDFRYVAWLLREKLNALVDGDQGEPPGLELRSLLNMAVSRKIISVDPKMLNPILWRTLPKDLLLLVFARLPVPDITRLRSLSKEWNRDMATVNSEINRACDESSPKIVAGFSRREVLPWEKGYRKSKRELFVSICTQRSQYSYCLHLEKPVVGEDRWHDMGAFDGGLVCFVSTWRPSKANPLCIVVVNLLTRVQRKLPPLQYAYSTPPTMMHIEVDSETKCYRMVVVGENRKGVRRVEIYDSGAGQWTKATPPLGLIFGLALNWEYNIYKRTFRSTNPIQSVYDFAKGQLKCVFGLMGPFDAEGVMMYEFQKDGQFVLYHKDTSNGEMVAAEGHRIIKYRMETNAGEWVQERSYLCSPIEDLLERERHRITLRPCEGFLLVFPDSYGSVGHFWLLDLSTGEWSSLPNCFQGHKHYGGFMNRAFWNVAP